MITFHETAAAVLKVLSGGSFYMALSNAAARRADVYYNYENMIAAYRGIYRAAAGTEKWRE